MPESADLLLTGKTQSHLVALSDGQTLLHREAVGAFEKMREEAGRAGIDLRVCSSFRSFEKQLLIWNEKVQGKRPLLDARGQTLDPAGLTRRELLFAMLRWSSVPGASRHHWGTDIDVFDGAAMPPDYRLQLTAEEYAPSGIFSKLAAWISSEAGRFGYFRPYQLDLGGVQPEPWHLSYAPLAVPLSEAYTLELFERTVVAAESLELRSELLENLASVYQACVRGVARP